MNILYHPQLSMRSYDKGKWLVSSDAQFTKILAYVNALPADWTWTFILPWLGKCVDESHVKMLPENVMSTSIDFASNVLEMRYHFNMEEAIAIIKKDDYDVMLLEVPEHARAWRVAQHRTGVHFPIISMVEHVDFYTQTMSIVPEQVSYYLRQVDGAMVSDQVAFPLMGMWTEWTKHMGMLGLAGEIQASVQEKCRVWSAIYAPFETLARKPAKETLRMDKAVINFISRLSDNDRTRYSEFFSAIRRLAVERDDFEVWVANPNGAMSEAAIRSESSVITKIGNSGRDDYLNMLWQSDIVPILYPQSHIYSLGFCEAITARNLVVTQRSPSGEYEDSTGIQITSQGADDIEAGLRAALDIRLGKGNVVAPQYIEALDEQETWLVENRSVDANIDIVRMTIEGAL